MKKLIVVLVAFTASVVVADLNIEWKNDDTFFQEDATTYTAAGHLGQLIWTPSASAATSVGLDGLGTGEIELATVSIGAFGLWNDGSAWYLDSDVGDTDINTGYFYTRVYNSATLSDSVTKYVNFDLFDASTKNGDQAVNPPVAGDLFSASAATGSVQWDTVTSTVIPEPATIGLLGIAGVGLFAARRKTCA